MYSDGKSFGGNGLDVDTDLLTDGADIVYAVFNDGSLKREDMLNIFSYFHGLDYPFGRAYLSVEGLGNQSDFELSDIELYSSLGVRMMSLTWNFDNVLSGGIGENLHGLTNLGRAAVTEMNRCNILTDISHISDLAASEVIELSKMPVCASHSNSRAVCDAARNLTDGLIKKISNSGGVVGVNFCSDFVGGHNCIDDVIYHIEHIAVVGGEKSVGIGSDFDGTDKKVSGLENCGCLERLYDRMLTKNHSETFIKRLFFGNFSELFKKYE